MFVSSVGTHGVPKVPRYKLNIQVQHYKCVEITVELLPFSGSGVSSSGDGLDQRSMKDDPWCMRKELKN